MPYHSPREFAAAVERIAIDAGTRVARRRIGTTVEGAPIDAFTVGAPQGQPDRSRPQAMVIAAIHGCEVISSELALAIFRSVGEDTAESRRLSDVADLTIVPAINLDGRAGAVRSLHSRRIFTGAPRRNARGVDLNRNWPLPEGVKGHWLPISGTTWRSPWFRGPQPLSEPETRAVAALVGDVEPFALLNLHSTGCIVTYPWSSKPEPPADRDGFEAMARAFIDAQTMERYRSKQSRAWYPIVGSSNDYFYGRHGTLAMTVETSPPGHAVREHLRRGRRFFWYANPANPDAWIANDRPACFEALRAAYDYRVATRAAAIEAHRPDAIRRV